MTLDELLTASDACERWGIHRKTLSRWLATGYIPGTREPFPYMRVGRRIHFSAAQITHIEQRMARVARARGNRR